MLSSYKRTDTLGRSDITEVERAGLEITCYLILWGKLDIFSDPLGGNKHFRRYANRKSDDTGSKVTYGARFHASYH